MKGPHDSDIRSIATVGPAPAAAVFAEARSAAGERLRPPEGKAFARLMAFIAERGFDVAPAPGADEVGPTQMAAVYAGVGADLGAQASAAAAAAPSWRPLGPVVMHNGQTYGSGRIDVSGRVAAIAVDPSNRTHILVGAAGGGVWESRDFGVTWLPRTDRMPTLTVGAIAFTPSAPATVYCGTGEGNFYGGLGAGLLRSMDGGATWAVLVSHPFVGLGFYGLMVDPAAGTHLVAATTGGLFASSNGGTTWTQPLAARTWGLAVNPAGGPHAEWLAVCSDGLHHSADGAQTWTALALPGAPAFWDRLDVAIARSNPAIAYAWGSSGGTAHLYRRGSNGVWGAIAPPPGLNTGQAWYDWYLKVAPDNDSQIYLGAIDLYRGDLAANGTWGWTDLSSKSSGDSIHPDQHALTFDPTDPNMVYAGSDGGLYRSPNRGVNWVSLNNGLAITEIEYIAQDYGSSRWLFGGTQDNGSIRYTGSAVWDHAADGDGGDCGVDRSNPNSVFHTYYGMGMERSTSQGDFGSWTWIGPPVPAGYNALFYPPVGCNDATIAQAGQSVFISRDSGATWKEVALPAGLVASAIAVPTTDQLVVGTTNGRLFRTTWGGSAWSAATALTQPRNNAWISAIFVDPGTLKRMWVTSSTVGGGRVFRADDGGQTWTDYSTGLPSLPMNTIEVDPANANRVWVGADLGVYQSTDGGSHWSNFSNGLPNVLVEDLLFQPQARVLRAGTRNRGVWEIPVDGWLAAPVCGTQWTGTLAANAQQQWFTFNWPATWHVIWTVMPTSVQAAAQLTWQVSVQRASPEYVTYWIQVKNLTSAPVTFEGRYAILSYY